MGRATAIDIGARFESNTFEIRNIDSEVVSGQVSLVRSLSPKRSLSLNVSADRIEYDDDVLNSNFDRQTAFIGFSSEMSRGSFTINAGVNEIHDNGDSESGFFGELSVLRKLSSRSNLSFSYNQRFSDAGNIFGLYEGGSQAQGGAQNITATSDPFENKNIRLAYDLDRGKSTFSGSLYVNENEYSNSSALDEKRTGVRLGATKEFGSGWTTGLNLDFSRVEFDNADREDDYQYATVSLTKQISRVFDVSLAYLRADRSSDAALADYVDNRYTLTISYVR